MGNLIAWMYNVTDIPIVTISVMKKEDAVKLFDLQNNSYRNLNFIYQKCNQLLCNFIFSFTGYIRLKLDHECNSKDESLENQDTVLECSKACREKDGCKYFLYGIGSKKGQCFWEKTESAECTEGWDNDFFDFFENLGLFH